MLSGGSRTICMIYLAHVFLVRYSISADPAQHLITADTGNTADDLDDLDRHLS